MAFKRMLSLALIGTLLASCSAGGGQDGGSASSGSSSQANQEKSTAKYRTVITTDGEVDDMNSMIRYFYYANEMTLEGIVLTSSTYHYAGDKDKGVEPYRWTGTEWLGEMIDAYERIQPNLAKHAEGYPSADSIRKITKIGNIKEEGEMTEVTEGSEFLKELFLKEADSPLYVQTWGGTNTTARALKSIEEEYKDTDEWEEIQERVYKNLVVYIILNQDKTYDDYIKVSWPKLKVINDVSNFWHFAYAWQYHSDELNSTLKADWQKEHILTDNGPLMDLYASMGDGNLLEGELPEEQRGSADYLKNNPQYKKYDFISEGDSPSYFYLLQNNLNNVDQPDYGGWGGRFAKVNDGLYQNTVLDYNPYSKQFEASYSLTRWFDAIQNDFATRIDWGIAETYEDANHHPEVSVKEGTTMTVKAGDKVTLTAEAKDPDGDQLTFKWWRYFEADTYQEDKVTAKPEPTMAGDLQLDVTRKLAEDEVLDPVKLSNADTDTVTFTVPKDAKKGDTLHLILEVKDDVSLPLTSYQRVVLTVE